MEKLMKFRFVHAADLHLDTPFQGLTKVNQHIGAALQEASLKAFDQLVQLTIDREASFLLLAGDIYDGAQRGIRAQFRFLKGLKKLSDRNIKTFIVHGNHDPLNGWSAIREWPTHVKVFGSDSVEDCTVEIDGKNVATIYGISYPERAVKENLSRRYQRKHNDGIHIGLLHCNLDNMNDHSPYAPCS
jgi:exonuclease SbcD